MSFIPAASIQQALNLPLQTKTSDSVNKIAENLGVKPQQTTTNYAKATDSVKQAEALYKLKTQSSVEQFTNLTRKVAITKSNGQMVATDASTGQEIVDLGAVYEAGQPANYGSDTDANDSGQFKVILTQEPAYGSEEDNTVIFDVMPTISEQRSASYDSFSPLHHPGEILKYKSTQARSWNVSARLISRTRAEATKNMRIINTIRSWVMPFYGQGTANPENSTFTYLGAPPPIITLKAYGQSMVGPVKCVVETYNWDFPNDVDYISTLETSEFPNGQPFPVLLTVSISLKESWSPAEYSGFDITSYRAGKLPAAFQKVTSLVASKGAEASRQITTVADVNNFDRSQAESVSNNDSVTAEDANTRSYDAPPEIVQGP